MKRRVGCNWETEFEILRAEEIFAEFDRLAHEEKLEFDRQERNKVRRANNLAKALRIRPRLYAVKAFNEWATTQLGEDEWGDLTPRNNEVKAMYAKKAKLLWVITSLFKYWAFNERPYPTFKANKRTLTLSYLSKQYDKFLEDLQERVRQENWDRKRFRVRARREAIKNGKQNKPFDHRLQSTVSSLLALRYGTRLPDLLRLPECLREPPPTLAQGHGKDRDE